MTIIILHAAYSDPICDYCICSQACWPSWKLPVCCWIIQNGRGNVGVAIYYQFAFSVYCLVTCGKLSVGGSVGYSSWSIHMDTGAVKQYIVQSMFF